MEFDVKIIVAISLAVVEMATALVAIFKGLIGSKTKRKLSQLEQENDLWDYMVDECSNIEGFARVIKNSMTKEQLADYKHSTVMKNLKLYAKANGYEWFNDGVWSQYLVDYIKQVNSASGKHNITK